MVNSLILVKLAHHGNPVQRADAIAPKQTFQAQDKAVA
jgi:hypothetical protein